jgi:Flp pilus assembly protein CpaB
MPELTTNLKNILIAAVLAIAAVALTLIYVSNSKSNQSGTSPATYRTVLVAARDIPVGTTGTQLAHAGWLTTRRVPSDAVASGTVPNKAALATMVAIQPTYHGEQIVA